MIEKHRHINARRLDSLCQCEECRRKLVRVQTHVGEAMNGKADKPISTMGISCPLALIALAEAVEEVIS